VLAHVVDGDDVLVGQLAGGARFAKEALLDRGVGLDRANQLDGDDSLQEGIEGPVDDTHPPLAEFLNELIPSDRLHADRPDGRPPSAKAR
jgi:hypothetical protein